MWPSSLVSRWLQIRVIDYQWLIYRDIHPGRMTKQLSFKKKCISCDIMYSLLFIQVEKKAQTTVLTAALLLSGIPAEVINRSMDTYRRMGDVFADLCVYFFTFILSHEILQLVGSETPWCLRSISATLPFPSQCPFAVSPIEKRHFHSWWLMWICWKRNLHVMSAALQAFAPHWSWETERWFVFSCVENVCWDLLCEVMFTCHILHRKWWMSGVVNSTDHHQWQFNLWMGHIGVPQSLGDISEMTLLHVTRMK